jgi:glycosyltransferase involved in cell wall biosynthesis
MAAGSGLRLALLSPCYFPEVRRGTERIVRELAGDLAERGHEPVVVTSHPGRPSVRREEGFSVVRQWRPPEQRLTRRLFYEHMTHLPFSYGTLRAGRFDLAHAFFPTDATVGARWSERTERPSVFSYMGLPDRPVLADKREKLRMVTRAVTGVDAVVVLSEAAAGGMKRWLGVEPRVIHPGVDLEVFSPGGERAPEPTIFCAAAADDGRKRVDLLVAAFRELRRRRTDARLVLVRPRDPEAVARLGLAESGIELIEPVDSPAELAPHYRRAWVSALTSYMEAFGLVLVESLACGTPVVATRSGAIPEVVDRDEIGVLFDSGDPVEVARSLDDALALADQAGTRDACVARARDFSTERCADAHEVLYRELLSARG